MRTLFTVLVACTAPGAQAQLYESHSKQPGATMDITVREIERRPRASVVAIEMRQVGSSVGSSFFVLCSIRQLAVVRGGFGHVAKREEYPGRDQMLIGFLRSPSDPPIDADPAFGAAGAKVDVIAREQFAPICDGTK
ncbi:MAG: hypothetical protein ACKVQU_14010 [Burkholderiales bacterium]